MKSAGRITLDQGLVELLRQKDTEIRIGALQELQKASMESSSVMWTLADEGFDLVVACAHDGSEKVRHEALQALFGLFDARDDCSVSDSAIADAIVQCVVDQRRDVSLGTVSFLGNLEEAAIDELSDSLSAPLVRDRIIEILEADDDELQAAAMHLLERVIGIRGWRATFLAELIEHAPEPALKSILLVARDLCKSGWKRSRRSGPQEDLRIAKALSEMRLALDKIAACLNHSSPEVAEAALLVLDEVARGVYGGSPEVVSEFLVPATDPWIIRAIESPHEQIRKTSNDILRRTADFSHADSVAVLEKLLRDERDDVRLGVLRGVSQRTDERLGRSLSESWNLSAYQGKNCKPGIIAVMERVSDPVAEIRAEATVLLCKLRAVFTAEPSLAAPLVLGPAREFLEEASASTSSELREAAVKLQQASVGVKKRQGLYVAELLRSDEPETQVYVLSLLRESPYTASQLKSDWSWSEKAAETVVAAIIECGGSRSAEVRDAATDALPLVASVSGYGSARGLLLGKRSTKHILNGLPTAR